jgi:hypothetical protein
MRRRRRRRGRPVGGDSDAEAEGCKRSNGGGEVMAYIESAKTKSKLRSQGGERRSFLWSWPSWPRFLRFRTSRSCFLYMLSRVETCDF